MPPNHSKIDQKYDKKKLNMFFSYHFWVAFGTHVGSILAAQIDPSRAKLGSKTALGTISFEKVQFHGNLVKPMVFQCF